MRLIILFLATITAARALTVSADGIVLPPGSVDAGSVVISASGVLYLDGPGTYTAASWSVSGEVRLNKAGTYIIVASSGSIAFNRGSWVRAPANDSGTTRVTLVHAGDVLNAGMIEGGIIVNQGQPPPVESPPLVNISTRSVLPAGQTISAGFVVGGRIPRRVLIRAVGPALATFGVTNALTTPTVTVFSQQLTIKTNAGWGSDPSLAAVFTSVGAFALPAASRDAAVLVTLNPGSYTALVGGGGNGGEVLTEIYLVD